MIDINDSNKETKIIQCFRNDTCKESIKVYNSNVGLPNEDWHLNQEEKVDGISKKTIILLYIKRLYLLLPVTTNSRCDQGKDGQIERLS